uniref:Uncharacterized protein n=1 Tax=Arundo donax TaxID=35708 RepID=A0A0A9A7H7_ARUDO
MSAPATATRPPAKATARGPSAHDLSSVTLTVTASGMLRKYAYMHVYRHRAMGVCLEMKY